jgi:hypothetical protein
MLRDIDEPFHSTWQSRAHPALPTFFKAIPTIYSCILSLLNSGSSKYPFIERYLGASFEHWKAVIEFEIR